MKTMTRILHVVIWQNIIQCLSRYVSKVLQISMVCMIFLRRKKSRKATPAILSAQKVGICELEIFQFDCHRAYKEAVKQLDLNYECVKFSGEKSSNMVFSFYLGPYRRPCSTTSMKERS